MQDVSPNRSNSVGVAPTMALGKSEDDRHSKKQPSFMERLKGTYKSSN